MTETHLIYILIHFFLSFLLLLLFFFILLFFNSYSFEWFVFNDEKYVITLLFHTFITFPLIIFFSHKHKKCVFLLQFLPVIECHLFLDFNFIRFLHLIFFLLYLKQTIIWMNRLFAISMFALSFEVFPLIFLSLIHFEKCLLLLVATYTYTARYFCICNIV